MDFEQAVIYRSNGVIAGERPYFVLPNPEMAEYFDACGGAPEARLIDWASQFIKSHGVFVDIGTHVGTWSIALGLGTGCSVHSFEAQPWLSRLCKAGMALNGLDEPLSNCAVGNRDGRVEMRVPFAVNESTLTASMFDVNNASLQLETGGASIIEDVNAQSQGFATIDVPIMRLDSLWTMPTLIKIDVEGAELDALKGAYDTIHAHHPTILFECWVEEQGQRKEELFRYLSDDLEYQAVQVNGYPEMWLAEPK